MRNKLLSLSLLCLLVTCLATSGQEHVRSPDPNRFEEAVRKYEALDQQFPPPANEILFLGSSTIENWPLHQCFPDLPVTNRGLGGSHMSDLLTLIPRLTANHCPCTIVLYEGDNDVAAGKPPQQIAHDFRAGIEMLRRCFPQAKIIVISVKPSPARWSLIAEMRKTNALLRELILDCKNATFVNVENGMLDKDGLPKKEIFIEDELHLNEDGYKLWSDILRCHLTSTATR